MKPWSDEQSKVDWVRNALYVPVVCDVLDTFGRRNQAMHQRLRPLDGDCCRFVGRARTAHWIDMDYTVGVDPYGLELTLMDDLKKGDVVVHSTDHAGTNAPWGELMSTAAVARGCVGCICDSNIRDCKRIMELKFPVFYAGIRPLDSMGRGRVMEYDVPIRCGDVVVKPGELVFADFDGIVVIPKDIEDEVLMAAAEKVDAESHSRRELMEGKLLRDVYEKYGVL